MRAGLPSRGLVAALVLAGMLSAGAGSAHAQALALDPSTPRQGAMLLVAADEPLLSPDGRAAESVGFAFARGLRLDTTAVEELCSRRQAARSACPAASRIGFGRYSVAVRKYLFGLGEAELAWSLDVFLGEPQRRGDAGSVVLVATLLAADRVGALLAPALGAKIPTTGVVSGRLMRRSSGRYGTELQFPTFPARVDVPAPGTATPARLELTLGAVRRVRQNFTRRFRVRTPNGFEIRRIPDHRLVGHHLLRTPKSCNGTWAAEVRVGLPGEVKRMPRHIACTPAS